MASPWAVQPDVEDSKITCEWGFITYAEFCKYEAERRGGKARVARNKKKEIGVRDD